MKTARDEVMQQYRRNFYKVYHSHIVPFFEKFEKERICSVWSVVIIAVMTIFLIIMCLRPNPNAHPNDGVSEFSIWIAIAAGALGSWLIYITRRNFIRKLKQGTMNDIMRVFGNMYWASDEESVDSVELEYSELFSPFTHRESDDSFWGEYKGIKFRICETHLRRISGYGKNRRVETVFKGVVIKFDFNKTVRAKTIISTKGDANVRHGSGGIFLTIIAVLFYLFSESGFDISRFIFLTTAAVVVFVIVLIISAIYRFYANKPIFENRGWSELKLEDPEFRKKYRVFSTDQVEGRYLVTTAFMERFKRLQTALGAKKAKCSMYDDSIMFAISTNKNLFEVGGLFTPLKNPKRMENFFNEITSIMRIIDQFKLDEKTGL